MNIEERTVYEKLECIYNEFADQLITRGWNGKFYGFIEICRGEVNGNGWKQFSLDNGFNMMLTDPLSDSEEEPCLTYWFDDNDVVVVEDFEQLLMAFQLVE